jgi:RIO kinase 1
MLERDVENLSHYFGQFAPELRTTHYGKEIWKLYQSGDLHPEVQLTGQFKRAEKRVDVNSIMKEIDDAREEAIRRRYEPQV